MNLVVGIIFKASFPMFTGSFRNAKYSHDAVITGKITKDSYGKSTGQHTFTFEVIECSTNDFTVGETYRKMGRNMYPNVVGIISIPENMQELEIEKSKRAATQSAKAKRENLFTY